MRKILFIIIIVLLVCMGYMFLINGFQIGNFQILSISQLEEQNKSLKQKIEDVNILIDEKYPKTMSELKQSNSNMKSSKEEYLKYTNLSSDDEIIKAMQQESYAIEFLWAKIGNHATSQGVNLKLEIASNSTGSSNLNDLRFTIQGSYIGITNFIFAIEDDTELNFRIKNFKLLPYQDSILQGTFTVTDIAIQGNTSTQSITNNASTQNSNTTENNTVNDTTTNNTTSESQNVAE